MIELSNSQSQSYKFIIDNLPKNKILLLEGSAGTGKTTLTKYLFDYFNKSKIKICVIAPTHKSKKVIQDILNKNIFFPVTGFTVASALGKIKEHSYVGTKSYSNANVKKLSTYNIFIIDEVSMISDVDLKIIVDYARVNQKQILIIGDSNQIPCPSAKYIFVKDYIERADSFVFTDPTIPKTRLTDIVRQAGDSPIIQLATFVRDHLLEDFTIQSTHYSNIIPLQSIYSTFKKYFQRENVNSIRIISYTNQAVKQHNIEVRRALEYDTPFVLEDILMGYTNLGWPDPIIENGQDYIVKKMDYVKDHVIGKFNNLEGSLIRLQVGGSSTILSPLFFVDINKTSNNAFIFLLIGLAEKVNSMHSSKADYSAYMQIKNKVLFTEDMYKFEDNIYTETKFKELHPLLFTGVSEIIGDGKIKTTGMGEKLSTTYKDLIQLRIRDNKVIGDTEMFSDRYKVIEKDIYYGYAITAHKAQGSTYQSAIVDEIDFQKINSRWNHRFNKLESRVKEKNQLRYVAYTRAKENLFIVCE